MFLLTKYGNDCLNFSAVFSVFQYYHVIDGAIIHHTCQELRFVAEADTIL